MEIELNKLLSELNSAWDIEPELLMKLGFTEKTMISCENALKDTIAITWHIDDVLEQDPSLTKEQCRIVLNNLQREHDACLGVNWDVIDCTIDILKQRGDI